MMLLMLLTGMMYRWNQKENFWWNRTVSLGGGRLHFGSGLYPRDEEYYTSEPHIGHVKVQWKHLSPEEATWEMESNM